MLLAERIKKIIITKYLNVTMIFLLKISGHQCVRIIDIYLNIYIRNSFRFSFSINVSTFKERVINGFKRTLTLAMSKYLSM